MDPIDEVISLLNDAFRIWETEVDAGNERTVTYEQFESLIARVEAQR